MREKSGDAENLSVNERADKLPHSMPPAKTFQSRANALGRHTVGGDSDWCRCGPGIVRTGPLTLDKKAKSPSTTDMVILAMLAPLSLMTRGSNEQVRTEGQKGGTSSPARA